jgi:hypothetical protein
MKNLLTLLVSVSVLLFLSAASASAQGKALGSGAAASVGHGHGADHDQANNGSGTKGDHDSHTDWQARFNERLQKDPTLAAKIQNLLPPGTNLKTAEMGFKDRGQFLAAAHVSKNLDIPWDQLKAAVTGLSAQGQSVSAPMSLGKAIQELKPTLTHDQVNDAVKKAEKQVREDTEKTPKDDHDTAWQTRFNERFQNDPTFAAKINSLLPQGTNLKTAEMGFENRGQFLAALVVSKNLGIPFGQLKAKITGMNAQGQTVSTEMSLGKAIHELLPTLTQNQVRDSVKTAEKQAQEDTERTGPNASN